MTEPATVLHATCVARNGYAVLLTGRSGAGKSDLALRLLDRGWALVSDDYTDLAVRNDRLFATPPATIAGRLEVRGIGIVSFPHARDVPVALILSLDDKPDRMPADDATATIAGIDLPVLPLDPREPSAPIKAELALARHRAD